ncbi:MAG: SIR2 family protein, partial [Deltaproteobacteria bacterium]|nr:SIR2 family protein [Deltaproteobacteria bacterium]
MVTESDYDGFLSKYPLIATYISNQLITKTAVFVGYSLDDPDFRQLWHIVSERLGRMRRMAYAILVNARPADVARFERRGVKVISLPGQKDKYGSILEEAFRELKDYMRENVISVSNVTDEQPLRELLLPRDATTRLCFFSLPLDLVPLYRDRIFPLIREMGLVPITADDVIAPGDSISAKLDALIDRASVMVVELTSEWTRAEYAMAVARLKGADRNLHRRRLHVIAVIPENEQIYP